MAPKDLQLNLILPPPGRVVRAVAAVPGWKDPAQLSNHSSGHSTQPRVRTQKPWRNPVTVATVGPRAIHHRLEPYAVAVEAVSPCAAAPGAVPCMVLQRLVIILVHHNVQRQLELRCNDMYYACSGACEDWSRELALALGGCAATPAV